MFGFLSTSWLSLTDPHIEGFHQTTEPSVWGLESSKESCTIHFLPWTIEGDELVSVTKHPNAQTLGQQRDALQEEVLLPMMYKGKNASNQGQNPHLL